MTNDHVAVVTGSATALGRAVASTLGRDHHVVLSDVTDASVCSALDELDRHGVSAEAVVADPRDAAAVELLLKAAHAAGTVSVVAHLQQPTATDPTGRLRDAIIGARHLTDATLAVAENGTRLVHALPPAAESRAAAVALRLTTLRAAAWTTLDDEAADVRLAQWLAWWPQSHRDTVATSLATGYTRWYVARRQTDFADLGARAHVFDADDIALLLARHVAAA